MIEKLKEILKRVNEDVDLSNVSEDTRLSEDLGLDSLSMMLLAMEIEAAVGFRFTEPVRFVTVKDVCEFLNTV